MSKCQKESELFYFHMWSVSFHDNGPINIYLEKNYKNLLWVDFSRFRQGGGKEKDVRNIFHIWKMFL